MKVSTSYLFDQATDRMSIIQNRLAKTQAQMAETKQVLNPSDAPDQAAAIQRLQGEIDRQQNNSNSLKIAQSRYQAEEVALSSANDILTRLKELSVQAANGTVSSIDRSAIAAEMTTLKDQLLSLGNTRDDNGNYLFSGTRVRTPAFVEKNGTVIYQGDQTQTRIPAGVDRTVQYTRAGTDVFARVVRTDENGTKSSIGFFDSLDAMINSVSNSDQQGAQQAISDLTQMHDNITLTQAQTGSDQQVVLSQLDILDQTTIRLKSTLSGIQDLDYTKAVTQMNKEIMALQAAMGSFSKISGLSLFDYIKN
jgi:flagellar hook-associated protein 3 FlgL